MGFLLAQYDEEKMRQFFKEEGREIGREEVKEYAIRKSLEYNLDVHLISRITKVPIEKVLKMKADLIIY
ncbi:hypothetical protein AN639_11470 [Candidatus Epulonipiscium fishelsonii]|uniref:Uncharacterized protein n=1 Tax=Candidatus Epulonipiscium fishelsonii TaxID=77094 RepID=A0ACC8X899_9FIRM|nr:hypothetical protein AN396_11540 [Epulopiscium sp. SCG-B11WGA-EpuloA1]ONI43067.1 hypothetical protein AN639_11470 [Epulopiscium sp. SCG-B05WGA-EpuloA1]